MQDSEIQSTGSLRGGAPHNQQVGEGLGGGGLRSPPPPRKILSINQSWLVDFPIKPYYQPVLSDKSVQGVHALPGRIDLWSPTPDPEPLIPEPKPKPKPKPKLKPKPKPNPLA